MDIVILYSNPIWFKLSTRQNYYLVTSFLIWIIFFWKYSIGGFRPKRVLLPIRSWRLRKSFFPSNRKLQVTYPVYVIFCLPFLWVVANWATSSLTQIDCIFCSVVILFVVGENMVCRRKTTFYIIFEYWPISILIFTWKTTWKPSAKMFPSLVFVLCIGGVLFTTLHNDALKNIGTKILYGGRSCNAT